MCHQLPCIFRLSHHSLLYVQFLRNTFIPSRTKKQRNFEDVASSSTSPHPPFSSQVPYQSRRILSSPLPIDTNHNQISTVNHLPINDTISHTQINLTSPSVLHYDVSTSTIPSRTKTEGKLQCMFPFLLCMVGLHFLAANIEANLLLLCSLI